MLHDFLRLNRDALIERCREEASHRIGSLPNCSVPDHGVPQFLEQLAETLQFEQVSSVLNDPASTPAPSPTKIGRTAALHGAELLRLGLSVDQVVHGYGDVCQAVTGLAVEQNAPISVEEFRILNLCLDNAIAGAVTAFGQGRQRSISDQVVSLSEQFDHYTDEQRRLIDIAVRAFSAMKTGKIGLGGATGLLLLHTLEELRALSERTMVEIRLEIADTATAIQ